MKRLRNVLATVAFVAAVLVCVLLVTLFVVERSGYLAAVLNRTIDVRLAQRLPSGAVQVHIGDARIRWSTAELLLSDVECDLGLGDAERTELDQIAIRLKPSLQPRESVLRVVIRGGTIRESPELFERLDQISRELGGADQASTPSRTDEALEQWLQTLPTVSVRDLRVETQWLERLGAPEEAGKATFALDLVFRDGDDGRKRLTGKAQPRGVLAGKVPTSIHFWSQSLESGGFSVHAQTRGLPLWDGPSSGEGLDSLLPRDFPLNLDSLRLDAAIDVAYRWGDAAAWTGQWRARLECPQVAWKASSELELANVDLHVQGRFEIQSGEVYPAHDGWELHGAGSSAWGESSFEIGLLGGKHAGPDLDFRGWIDARQLPLDADQWEAVGVLQPGSTAANFATALSPQGHADLSLGIRVPLGAVRGRRQPIGTTRAVAHLSVDQRASVAWHGVQDALGRRDGVPYPWNIARGDVVAGWNPTSTTPYRVAIGPLSGSNGDATVSAVGLLSPAERGSHPFDFSLGVKVANVPVDERLKSALLHLRSGPSIWADYGPTAGTVGAEVRVWSHAESNGPAASVHVDVQDADLRWAGAPVPLLDANGAIRIAFDRKAQTYTMPDGTPRWLRNSAVSYKLQGRSATVGALKAEGVYRRLTPKAFVPGGVFDPLDLRDDAVHVTRVEIDDMPVRGRDFAIVEQTWPDVEREVGEMGLSGRVNAVFEGQQGYPRAPYHSTISVAPRQLSAQPARFPLTAQNLRGNFALTLVNEYVPYVQRESGVAAEPSSEIALCIAGELFDGTPVAVWTHSKGDDPQPIDIVASGVRPGHPNIRGALTAALRQPAAPGEEPTRIDLSTLTTTGATDIHAILTPGATPDAPLDPTVRVHLRRNDLASGERIVRELEGTFEHRGRALRAERLTGVLGSRDVELRRVFLTTARFLPEVEDHAPLLNRPGFLVDPDSLVFQADLSAQDFPLDAEHLGPIIASPNLDGALEAVGLRGEVDIEDLRTVVTTDAQGRSKAAVQGQLFLHNVDLDAGFEYEGLAGRFDLKEFIFEDEQIRGWAQVDDLAVRVAGRELSDASAILSYVDGRLTLDDFDARFGRSGQLRSPGIGSAGSKAIAVDMAAPFHFEVALRADNIEVDTLLKDLFKGTFENAGTMQGQFRVEGSLDDLVGIRGDGWFDVTDAKLWSIPLASLFFKRFGAGDVTDFDRLRYSWQLDEGRFLIEGIRLRSKLLSLEGSGHLDLGGSIGFDLRISYSVLRYLGPFEVLLYLIQDSLLSVAIRGTFHRPRILVQNLLLDLLFRPDEELELVPLPPLAALPGRF